MSLRRWATAKLQPGDLTALASIAEGSEKPKETSVKRLLRRRFVSQRRNGRIAPTVRGRVVLMIRRSNYL